MAQGNQELGLPASPTDRQVSPGSGKGRRERERNATGSHSHQEEAPHQSGSMRAQRPRSGLCREPGLPSPQDAGIPPPCSCLVGLKSKSPFEEVPGQLSSLCKSEGPGPEHYGQRPFKPKPSEASTSLSFFPLLPQCPSSPTFPQFSQRLWFPQVLMKLLITLLHNQVVLFLVCCDGSQKTFHLCQDIEMS